MSWWVDGTTGSDTYNLLLLGDTDDATATTGGLGVLTTDTDTPVVTETTMGTDLLETLQILLNQIHTILNLSELFLNQSALFFVG